MMTTATSTTSATSAAKAWNRARAALLHGHFKSVSVLVAGGHKISTALESLAQQLDGKIISFSGGARTLDASAKTLLREWYRWNAGDPNPRTGDPRAKPRTAEALLLHYKAGNGGHRAVPRDLIAEIHRRATAQTGGRDKKRQAPLSVVYDGLQRDFIERKNIPGIDYSRFETGAEFPWSYATICRHKPAKTLRALGNLGSAAHKSISSYVRLNYSKLRKCELYTLDDVRLDIICIDEKTGKAIEVVCYILMEVASRLIVAYVMKPVHAIKAEDVDELLAHGLQTPGFGIGVGYTTHILFERGATACSQSAQEVLQAATEDRIRTHRTGMVGGIRWTGSARDKAIGNAAGKGVIESFNRSLHYSLLHLPGQRGNHFGNAPQNLGYNGPDNIEKESLAGQAQELAQFNIAHGRRMKLKLPMLYFMQVNEAVRSAIDRHNHDAGHDYSGHGEFHQAEVAPGVWQDVGDNTAVEIAGATSRGSFRNFRVSGIALDAMEGPALSGPVDQPAPSCPIDQNAPSSDDKREYTLPTVPEDRIPVKQRFAIYNKLWDAVELAKAGNCPNRRAILRRVTGKTSIKEMTDPEFLKLTKVLTSIAEKS